MVTKKQYKLSIFLSFSVDGEAGSVTAPTDSRTDHMRQGSVELT